MAWSLATAQPAANRQLPAQYRRQANAPIHACVEPAHRQMPFPPARRRSSRWARLRTQLLTAFVLGAACTAAMPAIFDKIAAVHADYRRHGANFTDIRRTDDPLALPRMYRDNQLFSYLDSTINRSTKQPNIESQPAAVDPAIDAETIDGDPMLSEANLEERAQSADIDDVAETDGSETPDRDRMATQPSLYFDPATRQQVIGNFRTRSFPGDHRSCTETAQAMISDAGGRQASLLTLADIDAIKVMKICAANGTVIITCRNDQITISPRRARPDDGCKAHQVSKPGVKAL
jgi:hypothetical protein